MQDFLPARAKKKQWIEDTCRQVFESYGFEPLVTPALEELETLTKKGAAGNAVRDEIYFFKDKGDREVGLRFDLTVPLARVVASDPTLKKPFKRYQIAPVWRYDRPQAGRFREFTQADADIVGSGSVAADFECIAVAAEIMARLGVKGKIRINNRKLLEDFALANGVEKEQAKECFRCLDKLGKVGKKEVEKEMREKKIDTKIISRLSSTFSEIEKKIPQSEGVKEIRELLELAKANSLEKLVQFDLSLARGLEYYTGNVFEVSADSGPSIGGGGRYDNLVSDYGGQKTPAVGISFGIERILELIEEKAPEISSAKIFVAAVSKEFQKDALALSQKIRALGINTETDLMERNVSKNVEYADSKKIPFVVFVGENELKEKAFRAKNMKTGKETKIKFSELEELKKLI